MKRTLTFLLTILTLLSFAACRPKNADDPPADSPSSPADTPSAQTDSPSKTPEILLKNFIVADNDVFSFKINRIDTETDQGFALEAFIKNKQDVPLTFSMQDSSINGYMCSPYWSLRLEPKSGEETRVFWYAADLELNGISIVRAIELTFCAREDDNSEVYSEVLTVYPYGDTVEIMAIEPRNPKNGETSVVETEDFAFVITDFGTKTAFAYSMSIYAENKSDKDVFFTLDTAKLNGYNCNPYWALKIPAGKRANTFVSWMDSDLDQYGITSVNEIEFNLRIYDAEDWLAPPILNQDYTVKP